MRPYLVKRARAYASASIQDATIVYDESSQANVIVQDGRCSIIMELPKEMLRTSTMTEIRTESPDRDQQGTMPTDRASFAGTETVTLVRNESPDRDQEAPMTVERCPMVGSEDPVLFRLALASTVTKTSARGEAPDSDPQ